MIAYLGVQDCLDSFELMWMYPYKDRMVNVLAVYSFGLLEEKGSEWQLTSVKFF